MVRGSGHDPVTSETKRFLYNGTIEQWDACKMHIRSVLHQKGLWRVTKEGPKNEPPTYDQPIDAGEYYYALQDNVTQGPVDQGARAVAGDNLQRSKIRTTDG